MVLSEPAEVIDVGMQPEDPTLSKPRYWFPAKTYGWGWGLPSTWEGWLVLVGYLALLALCIKVFPPHQNLPGFIVSVHVLSGLLIAICWWKGEPPKWRWGEGQVGSRMPFPRTGRG